MLRGRHRKTVKADKIRFTDATGSLQIAKNKY